MVVVAIALGLCAIVFGGHLLATGRWTIEMLHLGGWRFLPLERPVQLHPMVVRFVGLVLVIIAATLLYEAFVSLG